MSAAPNLTESDRRRLFSQHEAVLEIMQDGARHTIPELVHRLNRDYDLPATGTSVSARIRELRHPDFGGFIVLRDRRARPGTRNALWHYRLATTPEGASVP